MENDDSPLAPFVAQLKDLRGQIFSAKAVTDDVFDALVAQGRLLAVTEEEQPLYALNADQSGRKS